VALGFLIPPTVVKNHEELDDVGRDLSYLCYGLAICPSMTLVLLLLCKSRTTGEEALIDLATELGRNMLNVNKLFCIRYQRNQYNSSKHSGNYIRHIKIKKLQFGQIRHL
jgi:hypothetical protein